MEEVSLDMIILYSVQFVRMCIIKIVFFNCNAAVVENTN